MRTPRVLSAFLVFVEEQSERHRIILLVLSQTFFLVQLSLLFK
jgi:hypothetical protein